MLAIIAAHSINNSSINDCIDFVHPNFITYYLTIWGMWGKPAINSFILISGFFLCKSSLTWQRYIKILIEIYFYNILISCIFYISEYEPFNIINFSKIIVSPIRDVNGGFTASFLAFYLFVPFYNKLINTLNRAEHFRLLLGLLLYLTMASTFLNASSMNEPLWYATLYMIAAYIRLYPNKYTESRKLAVLLLCISLLFSILSVTTIIYVSSKWQLWNVPVSIAQKFISYRYFFVENSNKLFAFAVGISSFLTAKNLPSFRNKTINWLAAGTFGVFLIHASVPIMRKWLWQDLLEIPALIQEPLSFVILKLAIIPLFIFGLCTTIDYLRRIFFEKPIMNFLNKNNKS